MKKTLLLFGLTCFVPLYGYSNEVKSPLTLHRALSLLEENNPTIKSKAHIVSATQAKATSETMIPNPRGSFMLRNQPLSGGSIGPQATVVGASQHIPFPTKFFLKGEAGHQDIQMAHMEHKYTEAQLIFQIRALFAEIQSTTGELSEAMTEEKLLDAMTQGFSSQVSAGLAKNYSLYRVKIERTNAKEKILKLEEKISIYKNQLKALIALDSEDVVVSPYSLTFHPDTLPQQEDSIQRAQSQFPLKKKETANVKHAQAQEALRGQWWLPDITLSGDYAFRPRDVPGNKTNSWSVGVSLEIPLWFPLQDSQRYKHAYKKRLASEQHLVELDLSIEKKVRNIYASLHQIEATLHLLEKETLPNSKSIQKSAESEFHVGRISFEEYINSNLAYPRNLQKWYQTRSAHDAALAELAFLVGEPKRFLGEENL